MCAVKSYSQVIVGHIPPQIESFCIGVATNAMHTLTSHPLSHQHLHLILWQLKESGTRVQTLKEQKLCNSITYTAIEHLLFCISFVCVLQAITHVPFSVVGNGRWWWRLVKKRCLTIIENHCSHLYLLLVARILVKSLGDN